MADRAVASTGGIGVCGALGIAFVVLKLCGILDWSWWWVLAPFWIPPMAVIAALAAILTGAAGNTLVRRVLSGRTGTGVGRPSGPESWEPVHGWTKRQLDDYLARNPKYRLTYEAELTKRRNAATPK
jgi:hypothetical protein